MFLLTAPSVSFTVYVAQPVFALCLVLLLMVVAIFQPWTKWCANITLHHDQEINTRGFWTNSCFGYEAVQFCLVSYREAVVDVLGARLGHTGVR